MKKQLLGQGKSWQIFCKQNKGFAALLVLQLLVVSYFLAQLLLPSMSVTLLPEDFASQTETAAVSMAEGTLQIKNPQGDFTEQVVTSVPFALTPGAYTMQVAYTNAYNIANPSHSVQEESVSLSVTASDTQSLFLQSKRLLLKDSATSAKGRVWVSLGAAVDTAQIQLLYNGVGQTNLRSVTLVEQNSWWLMQLCVALLAFALINTMYLRFFAAGISTKPAHVARAKVVVALLLITAVASLPLFADFLYNAGHDLEFHLARIASVAAELSYGQFPVRMQSDMVNGYGYVNSLFYCDIFLYLPALLYNCMLPLQTAYQVYAVAVNFATACAAYFCFAAMSKNRNIALVGAAMYTLAIYRLMNVYLRAAVGEYTAMVFFPLVVLGMWKIYQSEQPSYRDWLPLALGMAGVLQCHVLSVEMLAIFLGLCCLLLLKQTFALARIKAFALAVMLCVGVTAWYWVPFLQSFASMQLVALGDVVTSIQSSGIYPSQLFALTGYASYAMTVAEMPITLGWALVLGAGLAGYALLKGRGVAENTAVCAQGDTDGSGELSVEDGASNRVKEGADAKFARVAMLVLFLLGVVATAFTLKMFPWDAIGYGARPLIAQVVNLVQFSWRYLAIATLCFAAATVLALGWLKAQRHSWYQASLCLLLGLSVGVAGLFYADFIDRSNIKEYQVADSMLLLSVGYGEYMLEGTDFSECYGEYMLEGTDFSECYTTNLRTSDDAAVSASYQRNAGALTLTYQNTSDAAQLITLPLWNYPNYQAVDAVTGEAYAISATETNCMQITVPAQQSGTVQIAYVVPMLWRVAEGITLLSWALLAFVLVRTRKGKAQKALETVAQAEESEAEEKVLQTV